jgi:hypothetical protein
LQWTEQSGSHAPLQKRSSSCGQHESKYFLPGQSLETILRETFVFENGLIPKKGHG